MRQFIFILTLCFTQLSYAQQILDGRWFIDETKNITFSTDGSFQQHQAGKTYNGTYLLTKEKLDLIYAGGTKSYRVISQSTDHIILGHAENDQRLTLKKEISDEMIPEIVVSSDEKADNTFDTKEMAKPDKASIKSESKKKVVKETKPESERINIASTYDVNRLRLGVKLLLPGIGGLHTEYVLPVLKNNIAPTFDYSFLPGKWIDSEYSGQNFKYWKLGANYYFTRSGRGTGFYAGLHYQKLIGNFAGYNLGVGGFGGVIGFKTSGRVFFGSEIGIAKTDLPIILEGTNFGFIPNLNISFGVAFL